MRKGLLFLGVFACKTGADGEITTQTPSTAPDTAAVEGDACTDAPITTYANFGRGFLTQHCNACHAATTLDRHGAPASVTFDDEEQVWQFADRILARATGEAPDMPPQGGVSEDDRYRLEVWLACGG